MKAVYMYNSQITKTTTKALTMNTNATIISNSNH